jgi:tetratricopeptide (TPR) repeat protein
MSRHDRLAASLGAGLAASLAAAALLDVGPAAAPRLAAQDAKAGAGAKAPELPPEELYPVRLKEAHVQAGARLEALGNFAFSSDLKETAVGYWKEALEFDPENRKSREGLGHEKKGDDWTPNEAKVEKVKEYEDSSRGEKKRGEMDKKQKDAYAAIGKLFADLGVLADRAGEKEAAVAHWKKALFYDDQNAVANERTGAKKIDNRWFSERSLAHKEFEKVYKATLAKAQKLPVNPSSCDDTSGIAEAAGIAIQRFRTKNFRIESNLPATEIKETLVWLERARLLYIDLFQVPEHLLNYESNPDVYVIVTTSEQKDRLVDATAAIPAAEKSFKKKFGRIAVTGRLEIGFAENGESAQRSCVHTATHGFTRDTLGNHAPWLFEALANAVSAAIKQADLVVCFSGTGSTGGIHLDRMGLEQAPGLLRDLIREKKDTPIGDFVKLPADALTAAQIAKAWSVVMFLLEKDRAQARDYFAEAGQGGGEKSQEARVLAQFFPSFTTWKELDAVWREWAYDVYRK